MWRISLSGGGGYSHVKEYRAVPPKLGYFLLFHQKSLDTGPILVKKSLEEDPISQKLQQKKKGVKSAIFEVEKTLRNESRFVKILKKA